ncbi:polyamine ABC transporter substrate-binding protein [Clostridium sp. YIM B02515]|uniref:Polyamine ABC transporter substrate-binding protein n=1 Tax=Clostridium rhizosphaerae TaxID=2803861 RepID=A0ABS1T748_9CLOT|nr:ABC transporter substrate-binding protein [Clostridium rhizosphaerae]MBL4935096.1 polyamine ABC transporter substrate-binding protein [Clostridium rhizosphaerae]
MKKLSILLAGIIATTALSGCAAKKDTMASAEAPKQLVVSTWGLNQDQYMKTVIEPFEKANNVKVVVETGNNDERLAKLKNNPNSTVDVMYLAESYSQQGIEDGLFEKIDYSKVPNAKKILPIAQKFVDAGYGPAYTLNRAAIVYNPSKVKGKITSWKDLWSADLKGKIAIPDIATTFGPAMVFAGGLQAGADIKGDNGASAFKSLEALKPNVVKTYTKSSDLVNMFSNGEIVAAVAADFVVGSIKKAMPDAIFVDPSEGSYLNFNTINITKNSKNKDLALKFVDFVLSADVESKTAALVGDSPINVDVKLDEKTAANLTYGDSTNKANTLDYSFVNKQLKSWIDQWNRLFNK